MPEESNDEKAERIAAGGIPSAHSLKRILEALEMFTDDAIEVITDEDGKIQLNPSENFLLALHCSLLTYAQKYGSLDRDMSRTLTNSLFLLGRMSVEHPEVLERVRATLAEKWGTVSADHIRKVVDDTNKLTSDPSGLADTISEALDVGKGKVHVVSSVADLLKILNEKLGGSGFEGIDLPEMKGDPSAN